MTAHLSLGSSEVHEPKHITTSSTGDAGKVITPSSTTAGSSELRNIKQSEVTEQDEYFAVLFQSIDTAQSIYILPPEPKDFGFP